MLNERSSGRFEADPVGHHSIAAAAAEAAAVRMVVLDCPCSEPTQNLIVLPSLHRNPAACVRILA